MAPWICLIVVEDGEIDSLQPAGRDRPLGVVILKNAPLPDLSQSWAWAHAQVLGGPDAPAKDFDSAAIEAISRQNPARLSARLLCPRQLQPQTSYQAFVVPTFERGRLAGIGDTSTQAARLAAAWQPGQPSVTLPFYFSWSFRTGAAGDFASLAAKLKPVGDLPKEVWQRQVAVSPPGVDPPNWQVVDLEGALIPPYPFRTGAAPTHTASPRLLPRASMPGATGSSPRFTAAGWRQRPCRRTLQQRPRGCFNSIPIRGLGSRQVWGRRLSKRSSSSSSPARGLRWRASVRPTIG